MKNNSLNSQWNSLSGIWKAIYLLVFFFMPWVLIFVVLGIWHLDSRIEQLEETIEKKNSVNFKYRKLNEEIYHCDYEKHFQIDTIESYKKET